MSIAIAASVAARRHRAQRAARDRRGRSEAQASRRRRSQSWSSSLFSSYEDDGTDVSANHRYSRDGRTYASQVASRGSSFPLAPPPSSSQSLLRSTRLILVARETQLTMAVFREMILKSDKGQGVVGSLPRDVIANIFLFLSRTAVKSTPSIVYLRAQAGDALDMENLIDDGCSLDSCFDGSTPLIAAARMGHSGCMAVLVARGADPDRSVYGRTALHEAAWHGRAEAVAVLLRLGASGRTLNSVGQHPFDVARLRLEMLQNRPRTVSNLFTQQQLRKTVKILRRAALRGQGGQGEGCCVMS